MKKKKIVKKRRKMFRKHSEDAELMEALEIKEPISIFCVELYFRNCFDLDGWDLAVLEDQTLDECYKHFPDIIATRSKNWDFGPSSKGVVGFQEGGATMITSTKTRVLEEGKK